MNYTKSLIALFAIIAIVGSVGMVGASHPGPHVNANNTDPVNGTYGSIQGAVDNATDGETIIVEPGTYNETVDVGTNNLTVESATNEVVTVNGSFNTSDVSNFTISENVTVAGDSSGGGVAIPSGSDVEDTVTATYYGIPGYIYILFALVIGIIALVEYRDDDGMINQ